MSIAILPTPPPTNNEWTQQVVRSNVKQAPFVLHDHSGGLYLLGNAYDSLKVAEVDFKNSAQLANDAPNDSPIHVVAHVMNRANFLAGFFKAPAAGEEPDSRPRIVLQVGRPESVADDSLASGDVVWLSMKSREPYQRVSDWLSQFLDLSFDDAVKIAEAKDRWALAPKIQRKYEQLLDITHPGDPTARLAFRLLCEAWKECGAKDSTELHGMTIHAPTDLPSWLQSFGAKNISEVVRTIDHEEIGAKAEKVLRAVDENGDLASPIEEFLSDSANSKS